MRRTLQTVLVGQAAAVAALAGAAPVAAAERSELTIGFTTRAAATPSGLTVHVIYRHPDDPERKPSPLTAGRFELPAGTGIDQAAAPMCDATDEEIRTLGTNACPAASEVGGGRFVAMTGTPADPVEGEAHIFNGRGQFIEIITPPGATTAAGFDRLTIEGTALVAHPPSVPGGPPDGRTAPREIDVAFPRRVEHGHSLMTTPGACPADGVWRSRGVFGFADGGTSTVGAPFSCSAASPPPAAPAPRASGRRGAVRRVLVLPKLARSRRHVLLRVRVSGAPPSCARRAAVRVAGRRARTNALGRARLVVRRPRSGRLRVRVTKRGCGARSGRTRVLPRALRGPHAS